MRKMASKILIVIICLATLAIYILLYYNSNIDEIAPTTPLKNFDLLQFYRTNSQRCRESSVLLLILIITAPANQAQRQKIRATWATQRDGVKVLFVLGAATNIVLRSQISKENHRYNDIIQGNFLDTYRNLTAKTVLSLKYVAEVCTSAKYVLKVDDDVFVNVPQLRIFVKNVLEPLKPRHLIMCSILNNTKPFRRFNKYAVTYEEYPANQYPKYCAGWAVLMTRDTVVKLYENVKRATYFVFEDVFTYGLVGRLIPELHWVEIAPYVLNDTTLKDALKEQRTVDFLIGHYSLTIAQVDTLWNIVQEMGIKEHIPIYFEG